VQLGPKDGKEQGRTEKRKSRKRERDTETMKDRNRKQIMLRGCTSRRGE
jgi:hypothetical protein